LGHAEELTGRDVADHGLLPLRRCLFDPEVPMEQQKEAIGWRALIENRGALGEPDRTRLAQQFVLLGWRKPGEQRQAPNKGPVDCGHRYPLSNTPRRLPAAQASLNGLPGT